MTPVVAVPAPASGTANPAVRAKFPPLATLHSQTYPGPGFEALEAHMAIYLTLYPDEITCRIWVDVVDRCRRAGRPIQTADAWIAAGALQWGCPLVTTDFGDYETIDDLEVVPIR